MPPKHTRASSGQLRTHSRSSSATRLGANLHLTQKEPAPKPEKPKKNGFHDTKAAPVVSRVHSGQRTASKEQLPVYARRSHTHKPAAKDKHKPGFTLSNKSADDDDDDDDDDDEGWVSSSDGAVTPSNPDSHSDGESDVDASTHPNPLPETVPEPLQRVDTARPSQFTRTQVDAHIPAQALARDSTLTQIPPQSREDNVSSRTSSVARPQHYRSQSEAMPPPQQQRPQPLSASRATNTPAPTQQPSAMQAHPPHSQAQRPSSKRQSVPRPPSSHSIRGEHALRPHPLIRGQSLTHIVPARPAPLTPLTMIPDAQRHAPTTPLSASPTHSHYIPSTSPESLKTSPASPVPNDAASATMAIARRTSISSAKSSATLPLHSSFLRDHTGRSQHDRQRTLSTMSSSSAALSSLAHLPAVTRPSSPQLISFFPPANPHVNLDAIHPLLPGPYLSNHLTVLVRRTPIKESFERVVRAKQGR